jgi:hypothetical protein
MAEDASFRPPAKAGHEPFTRKEFNELFRITPDMPREEVARRIRAVSYGSYQPYVEIGGKRFEYVPPAKQ